MKIVIFIQNSPPQIAKDLLCNSFALEVLFVDLRQQYLDDWCFPVNSQDTMVIKQSLLIFLLGILKH